MEINGIEVKTDINNLEMAAWALLANVSGGDWSQQSQEWQAAMLKWREDFHAKLLTWTPSLPPEPEEAVVHQGTGDERPHSRACGIRPHEHGFRCSRDCPTCHKDEK